MSECSFRQNRKGGVEEDKLLAIRGVLSPGVLVSWCPGVPGPKRPKKTQKDPKAEVDLGHTANHRKQRAHVAGQWAAVSGGRVQGSTWPAILSHRQPQVPPGTSSPSSTHAPTYIGGSPGRACDWSALLTSTISLYWCIPYTLNHPKQATPFVKLYMKGKKKKRM